MIYTEYSTQALVGLAAATLAAHIAFTFAITQVHEPALHLFKLAGLMVSEGSRRVSCLGSA